MFVHGEMTAQGGPIAPAQNARVAVVEHDRHALNMMRDMLEAEGFRVEPYTNSQTALRALAHRPPALVLADMDLPQVNGVRLLQHLTERAPTLPVVLMQDSDSAHDEALALSLGAEDYLRKPYVPRVMVERVRACLRRAARAPAQEAAPAKRRTVAGPLYMDGARHFTSWRGAPVDLTVTEFAILAALADHPGFVKSRDQLIDAMHGEKICIEERSVDSHVKRLRSKLRRVDPDFAAIRTLYGIGYCFDVPEV